MEEAQRIFGSRQTALLVLLCCPWAALAEFWLPPELEVHRPWVGAQVQLASRLVGAVLLVLV